MGDHVFFGATAPGTLIVFQIGEDGEATGLIAVGYSLANVSHFRRAR